MNLTEVISEYFRKKEAGEDVQAPEGVCPNCWGEQQYDSKFIQLMEDEQIDVNNHQVRYAFIQEFVKQYVDGIVLKKEEQYHYCSGCDAKYDHHFNKGVEQKKV